MNKKLTELQQLLLGMLLAAHEAGRSLVPEIMLHRAVSPLRRLMTCPPDLCADPLDSSGWVASALAALEKMDLVETCYGPSRFAPPPKTYRIRPSHIDAVTTLRSGFRGWILTALQAPRAIRGAPHRGRLDALASFPIRNR